MEAILKMQNVFKEYNNNEVVLNGVDLTIYKNTFNVIVGASGSGKSTLLNIMCGLLRPTSGKVFIENHDITIFNHFQMSKLKKNEISNVFQSYLLLPNLTVAENINIGLSSNKKGLSFDEIIEILDITDILDKFPHQLSGGQQQRTSLARAIIKNPKILFCDEATGSLDEKNSKRVLELLHTIKKQYGVTIIFITHNPEISNSAERTITIKDGVIFKDSLNNTANTLKYLKEMLLFEC